MDHAVDVRLFYSRNHACGHRPDRRQAPHLSGQASFAEEITGPLKGDHGLLPLLGEHGDLHLAFLNVENGIGRSALRVDNLILWIIGYGPSATYFREKLFRIERRLRVPFHHALETIP